MANPVLIAAPIAILPTAVALWYLLKRYEAYFDDSRVFLTLTFGFFAGLLAIFLELAVFPFMDPLFQAQVGSGTAFLLFVLGYPLFEAGMKAIILGTKRYRGRKDTPYYGAALGLGMGAMMALGIIAINLNAAGSVTDVAQNGTMNGTAAPGSLGYQALPFIGMILVPIGMVLAQGGAAVYIGRYVSRGSLWKGWLVGAALQLPAAMALALFWPSIGRGTEPNVIPGLFSIIYGFGLLAIARTRVLDTIVPADVLDRLKKAQRREARAAALGDEPSAPRTDDKLTVIPAESADAGGASDDAVSEDAGEPGVQRSDAEPAGSDGAGDEPSETKRD